MNNIYIINDIYNEEINLNFSNNLFILKDINYKFEFIENNIIKIYWNIDNIQLFITYDSYLYFSDVKKIDIIKKIYLIHNEWYDQAIVNMDNNYLFRIKSKDQFGIFEFNDTILKIIWNGWGEESYIKYDNYTYIQEDKYNKNLLKKIDIKQYIPIHIFIHICCIGDNWKDIFIEQINLIKSSGLYNMTMKIHLGILGDINVLNDEIFNDEKFEIEYIDKKIYIYEINTINSIKYFCENNREEELYILYIHTKGVRKAGNPYVIKSWRNMMEYFLIEKYIDCIKNLYIYDTLGCNIVNQTCVNNYNCSINENHNYHYSGNFWWSKKTYINKLSYLPLDLTKNSINTRYKAENWILSNIPNAIVGILYQDDTNTHPYHRYVFDYYKDMKFYIRKLLN
jgi:hypothetical protein